MSNECDGTLFPMCLLIVFLNVEFAAYIRPKPVAEPAATKTMLDTDFKKCLLSIIINILFSYTLV